ncbi:MAG TPA: sigma-54 dependent transcriptional regulator [Candidatus Manganitrophaceae bacterium]|nr:sigma-54 dependent transcriptional regulator [Candidatus Manganitrophaceae bacterium]
MKKGYRGKILVVDDDPDIRRVLQDRMETLGFQVVTAENGQEALEKVGREEPDLVFLDLQMPLMNGIQVLRRLKEHPELTVIIITAFGTVEKAVEAMKEGAFDFITKPFSPDHLDVVLKKALERRALKEENVYLHEEMDAPYREIRGESPKIREAIEMAKRVAQTPSTVLLTGESGTGKEVFARSIHRWSPRSQAPFVVVNCVALRDELVESELFGHEKGAFTGAHQMRRGKIEIADGGTLFLDEIGDFKLELQAKLLRFIQEREFERVGGSKQIQVDIRIIAATNQDLQKAVSEGRFREDLFFRLNVVSICLPPLRERREDIPLLVPFLLQRSCQSVKKPLMKISEEAMSHLINYRWPGNVRELGNLIERAVVLAQGDEIRPEDIPLLQGRPAPEKNSFEKTDYSELPYHDAVRFLQREVIQRALQRSGGNQARAAEFLKLQRTYLSRLIRNLGIK